MMKFSPEKLKHFRAKAGLTQKELALRVGISQKQISDYEVGTSEPRKGTFLKLLSALGISEEDFNKVQVVNVKWENDLLGNEDVVVIPVQNMPKGNNVHINKDLILKFDSNPDELMALVFYSKLFEPNINDGDVIVVDKSKSEAIDGRFYLVNINEATYVRRIYRSINGYLTLSAVDPILPKELYPFENVEIIGQIIYRQGFL